MLYIGHFSFYGSPESETPTSGFFNAVVEAADVDEAVDKLAALLESLKENDDVFDGVDDVFLDQCTQIASVPEAGFLDFWMAVEPEPTGSITTSLRGVESDAVTAFIIGTDDEGADEDEDEEGAEPFICWGHDHDHGEE